MLLAISRLLYLQIHSKLRKSFDLLRENSYKSLNTDDQLCKHLPQASIAWQHNCHYSISEILINNSLIFGLR